MSGRCFVTLGGFVFQFVMATGLAFGQATVTHSGQTVSVSNNATVALNTSVTASDTWTISAPAGTGVTAYVGKVEFVAPSRVLYADTISGSGTGTVSPSKTQVLNEVGVWKIKFQCDVTWMNSMSQTGKISDLDFEYTITVP